VPTTRRVNHFGQVDVASHLVDRMCGAEMAQAIQLAIEYDPQPPFDAGSPSKAPAEIRELVKSTLNAPAVAGAPSAG
jgi:hypothetical protein